MRTRLPALLAGLVLGAVALSGCSTPSGGAADLAGGGNDPGNRSPMLKAGSVVQSAATGTPDMTATALTSQGYATQQLNGPHYCQSTSQLVVCPVLRVSSSSASQVTLTAYVHVVQGTSSGYSMGASGTNVDLMASAPGVDGSHVRLDWGSGSPISTDDASSASFDIAVTIGNSTYHDVCTFTPPTQGATYVGNCSLDSDGA